MIQLIPYLNSPQKIQELLDQNYEKGRSLNRVILGLFIFKKSDTPTQSNIYISRNDSVKFAHVISQDIITNPNLTISYAQGQKQYLDKLDDDTLAIYYYAQKNNYVKQNNFLFVLPALFFLLLAYTQFNLAILGWIFVLFLFVLLQRYLAYRNFLKTIYKPMLSKTNIISEKGALKFVIVSNRKLDEREFSQLGEFGNLQFSNKKDASYVYILRSKTKHISINDRLTSFNNFDYELFRAHD